MEALGLGLEALGKSIGICARSFAMIYIVGIGWFILAKLRWILLRTGLNLRIMMDECRKVGIFCRNVSYGKRAKKELDKGDGTQFIIFPINNRDKLLGQRVDKAYVLDDVSYREILYLVQPCLKDRDGCIMIGDGNIWMNLSVILKLINI